MKLVTEIGEGVKEYVLEWYLEHQWYLEQSNVYTDGHLAWAVHSECVDRAAALDAFAELDEYWNYGEGVRNRHGVHLPIRLIRREIVAHSQPENKEEA